MKKAKIDQVIEIVRKIGILRPRDLDAHAIPREYLIRLSAKGGLKNWGEAFTRCRRRRLLRITAWPKPARKFLMA